jgi:hypothetical protein
MVSFLEIKVVVGGFAQSSFYKGTTSYMTVLKIMKEKQYITEFSTSSDGKVPAGKHLFSFSVLIPSDVPASIRLDYANRTYYSVKAELVIPWRFNKFDHVSFHVDRRDDFNSFPLFKVPNVQDIVDTRRNLSMKISVPYTVFTPSSSIPVSIRIVNNRSKPVGKVRIRLIQKVEKHG